jgi:glyoxylase I family protein
MECGSLLPLFPGQLAGRRGLYAAQNEDSRLVLGQFFNNLRVFSKRGERKIEKVLGIGGLFFRSKDPAVPGRWYCDHLGITLTPSSYDELPWQQEAGPSVVGPFPENTDYFGDRKQAWMVNFRVRNLDAMVAQLRAAGIAVEVDPQPYPNGRFARLHGPRRQSH